MHAHKHTHTQTHIRLNTYTSAHVLSLSLSLSLSIYYHNQIKTLKTKQAKDNCINFPSHNKTIIFSKMQDIIIRYLDTDTAFTTLFPHFRLKGAMYLNVTSRPPIFLWNGVGLEPSVVKNSLQFGASATHTFENNSMWLDASANVIWSTVTANSMIPLQDIKTTVRSLMPP